MRVCASCAAEPIHLDVDGDRQGPFSTAELSQLWRAGEIDESARYWYRGMTRWVPASEFRAPPADSIAAKFAVVPGATACPECGSAELVERPDPPSNPAGSLSAYRPPAVPMYGGIAGVAGAAEIAAAIVVVLTALGVIMAFVTGGVMGFISGISLIVTGVLSTLGLAAIANLLRVARDAGQNAIRTAAAVEHLAKRE